MPPSKSGVGVTRSSGHNRIAWLVTFVSNAGNVSLLAVVAKMYAAAECPFTLDFAGHFSDPLAADAASGTLKSILEGRQGTGTVKVTRSVSDPAVGRC